ncbi:hypothetical protein FIBSPDRAFT_900473 [Athelia psychrophila]|uniref:Uncharacterized protein n=1 Tax=Athelia psychrophila TaxID=1759441 RepID=A0A165YDV2_9AGAM|nr:hypothetical protein FIBSPDRAFT_900473 [Fibularhizoctonia sp. CBS 109695]
MSAYSSYFCFYTTSRAAPDAKASPTASPYPSQTVYVVNSAASSTMAATRGGLIPVSRTRRDHTRLAPTKSDWVVDTGEGGADEPEAETEAEVVAQDEDDDGECDQEAAEDAHAWRARAEWGAEGMRRDAVGMR